jgi:hypothetical protein
MKKNLLPWFNAFLSMSIYWLLIIFCVPTEYKHPYLEYMLTIAYVMVSVYFGLLLGFLLDLVIRLTQD